MRHSISALCATAICLVLSNSAVCRAQADPKADENTAEQTKDAPLMRRVAATYLTAGDIEDGCRTYLAAWEIARYCAIYSPNKWSTVPGVGGSGTRRAQGLGDMRSMATNGVPAAVMNQYANEMNGFLAELDTLERQGTADNPRRVLGGPVSNVKRPDNAREDMIGLWQAPNGTTLRIKQLGTQIFVAGGGAFVGLGKPEDTARGTFDGTTLRFSVTDDSGNRIDCTFAYSEEPASPTANFSNSVLEGTVTVTVAGMSTTLPNFRLVRTYNFDGGAIAFPTSE